MRHVDPDLTEAGGDVLAELGHDLRNALAAISTCLQVLRTPDLSGPADERARRTLERQGEQLIRLAGRVLNVARGGPAEESPADEPTVEETAESAHARRVLVVDDQRDAADSIATLLKLWGHQVWTAGDAAAALAQARQHKPDFCLLDIWLPGMNGYELAERLRQEPGLGRPVLVAMTGLAQEWDRGFAGDAGFTAHLRKPIDVTLLRELLDQPRVVAHAAR